MQYCRDEPEDNVLTDSESFKLKLRFRNNTNNDVDLKKAVPLKCKVNFWRTLETCLINCGISFVLIILEQQLLQ